MRVPDEPYPHLDGRSVRRCLTPSPLTLTPTRPAEAPLSAATRLVSANPSPVADALRQGHRPPSRDRSGCPIPARPMRHACAQSRWVSVDRLSVRAKAMRIAPNDDRCPTAFWDRWPCLSRVVVCWAGSTPLSVLRTHGSTSGGRRCRGGGHGDPQGRRAGHVQRLRVRSTMGCWWWMRAARGTHWG
jgi:hypothetical protein